jgi:predicted PolB exonuclease-like 3'-5' exonuclease
MRHNKLFVFDIETIPDTDAVFNLTGFKSDNIDELREEIARYHLELTGGKNSFPRQPLWKVVAISFLEANIHRDGGEEYYEFVRIESGQSDTEEGLVKGFFQYFDKQLPRLVTYNGRGFDLPVLKYRAMKYGVVAKALHDKSNKWENYTSRYSADFHCDLLETLSDFGASARCKMNEVCTIVGLPGKFGVDGSNVSVMYDDGDVAGIRQYCEADVLNTYLLYLRQQQHMGITTTASHNKSVTECIDHIHEHQLDKPYLMDFYNAWDESCGGKFTLGEG